MRGCVCVLCVCLCVCVSVCLCVCVSVIVSLGWILPGHHPFFELPPFGETNFNFRTPRRSSVDGRNPAPPKKPWNDDSPNNGVPWFPPGANGFRSTSCGQLLLASASFEGSPGRSRRAREGARRWDQIYRRWKVYGSGGSAGLAQYGCGSKPMAPFWGR